jgi:hypothetical protein
MFRPRLAFRIPPAETFHMQHDASTFDYRSSLAEELRVRQARNPRYSLRSFARDLGVSVTALSDVLSAKRHFSKKNVARIVAKLGWSPLQEKAFLETVAGHTPSRNPAEQLILADDRFQFISEWYYLAILNLARLPHAKASATWIAKHTGITETEASEALSRLKRLGYISTVNGKLQRQIPEVKTTSEVPSAAIRKYHRQNFLLAEKAQEFVAFERRQISSFTVATTPERMQKAKKMLTAFMDKLADVLDAENPTEVYTVSTQMFPARLTDSEEK